MSQNSLQLVYVQHGAYVVHFSLRGLFFFRNTLLDTLSSHSDNIHPRATYHVVDQTYGNRGLGFFAQQWFFGL